MYRWRRLNERQRQELLEFRRSQARPWHSPPHYAGSQSRYLLSAACYEHRPHIAISAERMSWFCGQLMAVLDTLCEPVAAWCVLPNHYHALVHTHRLTELLGAIGQLHGRTSHAWNLEDNRAGRKVWFNCAETAMKSDRHYWATLNYVHHNAVHHRYVERWQEWPFSSAADYLEAVGPEMARRTWQAYPILDYGKEWDPPER